MNESCSLTSLHAVYSCTSNKEDNSDLFYFIKKERSHNSHHCCKFLYHNIYSAQMSQSFVLIDSITRDAFYFTGGTILFDEEQPFVHLQAEYIVISHGGSLRVGTEDDPYTNEALITLHGHVRSIELPIYGAKVLAVSNGTIDLHGKILQHDYWSHLMRFHLIVLQGPWLTVTCFCECNCVVPVQCFVYIVEGHNSYVIVNYFQMLVKSSYPSRSKEFK